MPQWPKLWVLWWNLTFILSRQMPSSTMPRLRWHRFCFCGIPFSVDGRNHLHSNLQFISMQPTLFSTIAFRGLNTLLMNSRMWLMLWVLLNHKHKEVLNSTLPQMKIPLTGEDKGGREGIEGREGIGGGVRRSWWGCSAQLPLCPFSGLQGLGSGVLLTATKDKDPSLVCRVVTCFASEWFVIATNP